MKKTLFIAAAVALLLAFLAGALYYKSEKAGQAEQLAAANRSGLVRAYSPRLGQSDAKVLLVEFIDPACGTCRRFYPFVKEMLNAHPEQMGLALRYAPFHENSDQAVALLLAADKQGLHWEALEALLNSQDDWVDQHVVQPERIWRHVEGIGLDLAKLREDMKSPEIAAHIAQDMADAKTLNVSKTPDFFVNGKPLPSFGYEPLQQLVDEALAAVAR